MKNELLGLLLSLSKPRKITFFSSFTCQINPSDHFLRVRGSSLSRNGIWKLILTANHPAINRLPPPNCCAVHTTVSTSPLLLQLSCARLSQILHNPRSPLNQGEAGIWNIIFIHAGFLGVLSVCARQHRDRSPLWEWILCQESRASSGLLRTRHTRSSWRGSSRGYKDD